MNLNYELQKLYLGNKGSHFNTTILKKIIESSEDEVIKMDESIKETDAENKEIVRRNRKLFEENKKELLSFYRNSGIEFIKKYDRKGKEIYLTHIQKTIDSIDKFNHFTNPQPCFNTSQNAYSDLSVTIDGFTFKYDSTRYYTSMMNKRTCHDIWKQFRLMVVAEKKQNEKYIKAVRYFVENNIEGEPSYEAANKHAMDLFVSSLDTITGETHIDCCSECSTWVVGEHRCSCGNRRMYWEIDGNFIDGFYNYPQAY